MSATINGKSLAIQPGERLVDVINRSGIEIPQVCFRPQLGPIQTCDTCMVEVSPELAGDRGIRTGSWVQLTSRYGKVRAQAVVTTRVQGNELCMPMNSIEEPVNRLTSSHTDKATRTPAYKETSVQLRLLGETGEDPLPRTNFRHGHPTPQSGVEVERKWKRKDYRQPGNQLVQIQTR